jgi:hypothetical protein
MEQLHEMDLNSISEPEYAKVEICLECEEAEVEAEREKEVHRVPIKTRLAKLFRKSRYNAKYLDEVIPIQRVHYEQTYRNSAIW